MSTDSVKAQTQNYLIDSEAVLNPLRWSVTITQGTAVQISRVWTDFTISYSGNGRTDVFRSSMELRAAFGEQELFHSVPEIRGGTYQAIFYATVKYRGYSRWETESSGPSIRSIGAVSPAKARVRQYLNDVHLESVVYLRSRFIQFVNGDPDFDSGFGLYRLKNPTAQEIWSWKQNADNARADFAARKTKAAQIPEDFRRQDPQTYAGLPDFTEEQITLEALQSYGSGSFFKPKRPNPQTEWTWTQNQANDGFGERCMTIVKRVAEGNEPPDWN